MLSLMGDVRTTHDAMFWIQILHCEVLSLVVVLLLVVVAPLARHSSRIMHSGAAWSLHAACRASMVHMQRVEQARFPQPHPS